jgi:hypothetical protein
VAAPVANGLLAIGGAIAGQNFLHGERSFEAMGLAGIGRAELRGKLDAGGL